MGEDPKALAERWLARAYGICTTENGDTLAREVLRCADIAERDGRDYAALKQERDALRKALEELVREVDNCLDDLDPCADDPDSKTYDPEMGCSEFHNLSLDALPRARAALDGEPTPSDDECETAQCMRCGGIAHAVEGRGWVCEQCGKLTGD